MSSLPDDFDDLRLQPLDEGLLSGDTNPETNTPPAQKPKKRVDPKDVGRKADGVSSPDLASVPVEAVPLEAITLEAVPVEAIPVVAKSIPGNSALVGAPSSVPVQVLEQASLEEVVVLPSRGKSLWGALPAWTVSLTVHVSLILLLAAWNIEPIQGALSVYINGGTVAEESNGMENFDVEAAEEEMELEKSESEDVPESMPDVQVATETTSSDVKIEVAMGATMPKMEMPSLTQQLTPSSMLSAQGASLKKSLSSRSTKMKREMLERYGGNKDSEKAVSMALKWLAMHQLQDGSWSFTHGLACNGKCDHPGELTRARNAATGLALMPFLGAGQTHVEGEYKETVYRGLSFLLDSMKVERGEFPTGSWHEAGSNMYGHGIASIAVCEAYAMTGDETLANPAQLCLNFITYAQDPMRGGWQYAPRQGSDTSVVGWQLMALKSGAMGGLVVQLPTLKKAEYFLDSVQTNDGAFYGYTNPDANIDGPLATSACGLLCRMYMGWQKNHPALVEGVNHINKRGPDPTNMYYNYYATQVMKQQGGDVWESWNPRMRDQLIKSQDATGHSAGSWYLADNSVGDPARQGGRLYLTCMSTMILEVYYRHMPIYGDQMEDDAFKF